MRRVTTVCWRRSASSSDWSERENRAMVSANRQTIEEAMEYTFPDYCCVCLDPEPQSSWQFDTVEVGYDKKTGEDWTKETWIDVPMCDQCRRKLKARRYKLAFASIPF